MAMKVGWVVIDLAEAELKVPLEAYVAITIMNIVLLLTRVFVE